MKSLLDVVALPGNGSRSGSGSRNGSGTGSRNGNGNGSGNGGADGGDIARRLAGEPIDVPPPPPLGEKLSKARPARLVYPSRDSETDAERLFVAIVTVDTDGYVVGAHLTTGEPGPLHDDAAGLIFKFRYDPALDDDGRPIRSTFEQPFQLAR